MKVIAQQGDSIDSLCWKHLGSSAAVEQVYLLNPGIAALGEVLPMGTPVILPEQDEVTPTTTNMINLWD